MNTTRVKASIVGACVLTAGMMSALSSSAGIDLQSAAAVWLFDDGAGVTAKDFTGKGNDGTLMNGPQWVEGKFGGALEFDGTSSYVAVDQPVGLPVQWEPRTVVFWFEWAAVSFARNSELIGTGPDFANTRMGVIISAKEGLGFETSSFREQWLCDWDGDTEWHHFAMALPDGERTKSDQLKLYLDGELCKGHAAGGNPSVMLTNGVPLTIGVEPQTRGSYFKGILDDVAIFPRELSAAEIKSVMQTGLVGAQDVSPQGKLAAAWGHLKAR